MALWTFKQKVDAAVNAGPNGGSTVTAAWGTNTVAGDLLICVVTWAHATVTISSVTDNAGTPNTWVSPQGAINYGTNQHLQLFYALANTVGGTTPTVTVHFSGTGVTNYSESLAEYTPFATGSNAADQTSSGTGTSTVLLPGSVNTTQVNELVIIYGGTGVAETWTGGTLFTLRTTSASRGNAIEDSFAAGSTAVSAPPPGTSDTILTIGASVAWGCGVITFEPGQSLVVDNPLVVGPTALMATRVGAGGNGQLPLGDGVTSSAGGNTVFNAG